MEKNTITHSAINENTTKITKYELFGKLPNPFVFDDGTTVKTTEDWQKRRAELYEKTVNLQFGGMPPEPEFLEVEPVCYGEIDIFKITTGTRKSPVTFNIYHFKACSGRSDAPVVISGDMCFLRTFDTYFVKTITDNDINLVMFSRACA